MKLSPLIWSVSIVVFSLAVVVILVVGTYVLGNEKERHFDSWADAPTRGDLAFVPPYFVPTDATDLRIRTVTDGPGGAMAFESRTGPVPSEHCTLGTLDGTQPTEARWWPTSMPLRGTVCSNWSIFQIGDVYYAYST